MGVMGVIPARYDSTRFPGKVLADLKGKPLIEWVYLRAKKSKKIDDLFIATDDERVIDVARSFGAKAILTDKAHKSGTDRMAEIARTKGSSNDIWVNIQGDEPYIDPNEIDEVVSILEDSPKFEIATLCTPFKSKDDLLNPHKVKCLTGFDGSAIYFSRLPIPYSREEAKAPFLVERHIGIYAFRTESLYRFTEQGASPLEKAEGLEQLRALDLSMLIGVKSLPDCETLGIDTVEDLKQIEAWMNEKGIDRP